MSAAEGYPEMLTIPQLREVCELCKDTVSRYIADGLITVKRWPNGRVGIPAAGLEFLPPFGDRLLSTGSVIQRTRLTRSQLQYARTRGLVTAVRMPGNGNYRFLESQMIRKFGW